MINFISDSILGLDENKLAHLYLSCVKHVVNSTLSRPFLEVRYNNRIKTCVLRGPIVFQQSYYHWLVYFVCQIYNEVQQGKHFGSAYFSRYTRHTKVTLLMLQFKCPAVYKCNRSLVCVIKRQYWISFEAAALSKNMSFIFSRNDLQTSVRLFVLVETFETYIHYNHGILWGADPPPGKSNPPPNR